MLGKENFMEYNNTVSIIMPVYNEEKYIRTCLDSILKQTYPYITEILIIDGISQDSTRTIINQYQKTNKNLILVDNKDKIQSAALNIGIEKASGEIIVRVDAHAIYEKAYVENCVSTLNKMKEQNVVNVGGPTYLETSGGYIENAIVFLHESKFGIGVAKFRQKDYEGFVDTVWNGAFWRWVFQEIGLYNTKLTRSEDNDMNNRICEKGYKIYQSKDIIATYKPRNTIGKILSQNMANGKAIGGSLINNRQIIRIRHLIPLFFVLSIVFFGITAFWFDISIYLEILALGSYFAIDIIESFRIGAKNGMQYVPIMVMLFFLLHVAYGIGTLTGYFKEL